MAQNFSHTHTHTHTHTKLAPKTGPGVFSRSVADMDLSARNYIAVGLSGLSMTAMPRGETFSEMAMTNLCTSPNVDVQCALTGPDIAQHIHMHNRKHARQTPGTTERIDTCRSARHTRTVAHVHLHLDKPRTSTSLFGSDFLNCHSE